MFKIGEFSRFSRVSVKMLRHYDRLELLRPAHVDPFTGYRYYSADQLPRLHRLLALKDLGFSLEQIQRLLDEALSDEELNHMLRRRRAELVQDLEAAAARLRRVDRRLTALADVDRPLDVLLRAVPDQWVAAVRFQTSYGESGTADAATPTVPELFEAVETAVARANARATLPPLLLMHDVEYREEAEEVEIAIPVQAGAVASVRATLFEDLMDVFPLAPPLQPRVYRLPGHPSLACAMHTGSYDSLPAMLTALLSWIQVGGYTIDGAIREAYLRFGADLDGYSLPEGHIATSSREYVTELQVPVVPAVGDDASRGEAGGAWEA